jgi:hypothetical protein
MKKTNELAYRPHFHAGVKQKSGRRGEYFRRLRQLRAQTTRKHVPLFVLQPDNQSPSPGTDKNVIKVIIKLYNEVWC